MLGLASNRMVNADNCAVEIAMGILYRACCGWCSKSLGEGLGDLATDVVDDTTGIVGDAAGDIVGTVSGTADQLLVPLVTLLGLLVI